MDFGHSQVEMLEKCTWACNFHDFRDVLEKRDVRSARNWASFERCFGESWSMFRVECSQHPRQTEMIKGVKPNFEIVHQPPAKRSHRARVILRVRRTFLVLSEEVFESSGF